MTPDEEWALRQAPQRAEAHYAETRKRLEDLEAASRRIEDRVRHIDGATTGLFWGAIAWLVIWLIRSCA